MTGREIRARRKLWEAHHNQFAQLRADIFNAWRPRKDQREWEASDFGAIGQPRRKAKHPRFSGTPQELQRKVVAIFGPDGKPAKQRSAVAAMKGKGQALPRQA